MSKAAKQRRFLKWKRYRRQCAEATGQTVPFTVGMGNAWIRAMYRIKDGEFYAMPPWHNDRSLPIGSWESRKWEEADE